MPLTAGCLRAERQGLRHPIPHAQSRRRLQSSGCIGRRCIDCGSLILDGRDTARSPGSGADRDAHLLVRADQCGVDDEGRGSAAARRRMDRAAARERRQAARDACHHALAEALRAYIDAAGIAEDRKGWLFRTARGHKGKVLSDKPMGQPDAWRMIRRRAAAAGIAEAIGCHTFRATGSPPISPMAARSSTRRKWPRMRARAPPSSTTGRRSGYPRRGRENSTSNNLQKMHLSTAECNNHNKSQSIYGHE